jgi:hypothetical protein
MISRSSGSEPGMLQGARMRPEESTRALILPYVSLSAGRYYTVVMDTRHLPAETLSGPMTHSSVIAMRLTYFPGKD